MYPRGVGTNALFSKIWCYEGFLPTSVGQFTAHSAGWLILFLVCCTNRSGPSVHAANSSKPPPTPCSGSCNSLITQPDKISAKVEGRFGIYYQTLVCTFPHRIIDCWIQHVPWTCAKTNCLLSSKSPNHVSVHYTRIEGSPTHNSPNNVLYPSLLYCWRSG
jgi:hypothetical protein